MCNNHFLFQKKIYHFQKNMCNKILFGAIAAVVFSSCGKTPTAAFKFEQATQAVPSKVAFKNESINGKIYDWDFGDGKSQPTKRLITIIKSLVLTP